MNRLPLRTELNLSFAEVLRGVEGKLDMSLQGHIEGVALDTRSLKQGDLFFALKATRDGHDFVDQAFEKGACAAVVEKKMKSSGPCIRVKDTWQALGSLANQVRMEWGGRVVGISGSNGKTTTKEMAAAIFGTYLKTLKAPGTWNNALGIPLSLFQLREMHEVAVLEMGINDFGEMTALADVAKPNVGVLTNIGPGHLEKFKSIEGVMRAKGELFEAMDADGIAVINADDPYLSKLGEKFPGKLIRVSMKDEADVLASVTRDLGMDGLVLNVSYGSEFVELKTSCVGIHNVYNLLCALGAALALGVPVSVLQEGVNQMQKPQMRLEIMQWPHQISVINDCYNANPASMAVALEIGKDVTRGRVIAVLGDMMELGDLAARAHRDIGIKVAQHEYAHLFVIGQFSGDIRQGALQGGMKYEEITVETSHLELARKIANIIQPKDTILIKGSRGMRMEKVTEELRRLVEGEAG